MSRTKTITVTVGSLAAGALLATGITGVALAADSSPSPSSSSSASAPSSGAQHGLPDGAHGMRGGPDGGPGGPDGGHGGHGMLGAPGSEALHGQAVVKAADGTISTVSMVRGSVTAVSSSSITVKAEDGYTATYAISSSTDVHTGLPPKPAEGTKPAAPAAGSIADVKVGDVADVEGTTSGGTSTATEVRAMSAADYAQMQADRAAHDAAEASGLAAPSGTQAG